MSTVLVSVSEIESRGCWRDLLSSATYKIPYGSLRPLFLLIARRRPCGQTLVAKLVVVKPSCEETASNSNFSCRVEIAPRGYFLEYLFRTRRNSSSKKYGVSWISAEPDKLLCFVLKLLVRRLSDTLEPDKLLRIFVLKLLEYIFELIENLQVARKRPRLKVWRIDNCVEPDKT